MARRRGTTSSSATAQRSPQTLATYVQVAIDASTPEIQLTPKKSRRRRKKQQQEPSNSVPAPLQVKPAALSPPPQPPAKPKRRKRKSKLKHSVLQSVSRNCKFRVRGLVTPEELEDEDEAEEVQDEVRADFTRFGELQSVTIVREEEEGSGRLIGDVVVTFQHAGDAASAFSSYNGNVFGGKTVTCIWETQNYQEKVERTTVVICGMMTPEELQDPDELADVEEEMMQIFSKHGEVKELQLGETTGDATVTFIDAQAAGKAVQTMDGSRYGGRLLTASLAIQSGGGADNVECVNDPRIVETKRFATPIIQPTESLVLQDLVGTFLKRLAALQERAHTQNPRQDKRSRRLVLGLHEVRRGLLCNKIVLLVIATDLDRCQAVEEKYAELVSIATEKEVPILAPMNRRKLGKVLQKSVRVSCVGVYSVEGANDLFQQISLLQSWQTTISR